MKIIWYTILIRAVPEAMGQILVALAVSRKKFNFKQLLTASLICGLGDFAVRMLPIKFGIHTLIGAVFQVFIINIFFRVDIYRAFRGILISIFIIGASEMGTIAFIQYVLEKDPIAIHSTTAGTLIASTPSIIFLYLAAFLILKINNKRSVKKEVCNNAG